MIKKSKKCWLKLAIEILHDGEIKIDLRKGLLNESNTRTRKMTPNISVDSERFSKKAGVAH
mgnify:CR=1 FL=1|jgi:hypothetical protein